MAGKIFINYRRDDVPGDARGIREALVSEFGKDAVFMDVDNLLAGQRFDKELEQALAQCQVLIAVMGPRWMELLTARAQSGERDYVREEIAAALKRSITVFPVRVGREGQMVPLPREGQLPEDIRDLLLHQKQDVAHERFGRDMVELVSALRAMGLSHHKPVSSRLMAGGAGAAIAAAVAAAWYIGVVPAGVPPTPVRTVPVDDKCERYWDKISQQDSIDVLEAFMRQCGGTFHGSIVASRLKDLKAVREKSRAAEAEAQRKAEQAEAARAAAEEQNQAKIKADAEAEKQRLAMLAAQQARERSESEASSRRFVRVITTGDTLLGSFVTLAVRDSLQGAELAPASADASGVSRLEVSGSYKTDGSSANCNAEGVETISYALKNPDGSMIQNGEASGRVCLKHYGDYDEAVRAAYKAAADELVSLLNHASVFQGMESKQ